VFNGDVTVLDDEEFATFLRTPNEVSGFFFMGGLPTFLLGSSLALGAARFLAVLPVVVLAVLPVVVLAVLPVVVCFAFSLGAVVTAGTSTSICFAISGRRTVVEGCGISCN